MFGVGRAGINEFMDLPEIVGIRVDQMSFSRKSLVWSLWNSGKYFLWSDKCLKNPLFFLIRKIYSGNCWSRNRRNVGAGIKSPKKPPFCDLRILNLALQLLLRAENSKGKLGTGRSSVTHPKHLRDEGTGRM